MCLHHAQPRDEGAPAQDLARGLYVSLDAGHTGETLFKPGDHQHGVLEGGQLVAGTHLMSPSRCCFSRQPSKLALRLGNGNRVRGAGEQWDVSRSQLAWGAPNADEAA